MLAAVVMLAAASWALDSGSATADEAGALHSLEMPLPSHHSGNITAEDDDVEYIPVSPPEGSCLLDASCIDVPSTSDGGSCVNAEAGSCVNAEAGGAPADDGLVLAKGATAGSEAKAPPPVVSVTASQYTQYVIVQKSVPWSVQNFKALNPYCTGPAMLKNPDGGVNAVAYLLWTDYPFTTLSSFNVKGTDIKVMYTTNISSIPQYFTKIWLMCNLPIVT